MNKKTIEFLTLLLLATSLRAETVTSDKSEAAQQAAVELGSQLIAPWAWNSVKEAIDGISARENMTINYSALNSVQMDMLKTRNVALESNKPLHWEILLNEVLRGLEFGFIQNDAGVVEIMPFAQYHAWKTDEARRRLQNNHALIEVNCNRMPLMQAITEIAEKAGVALNTGYLPLEIRNPEAASASAAPADGKAPETAAQRPVYETDFNTVTPMEWRNTLKNILDPFGYDFVEVDGAVCPMDKSKALTMQAGLLAAKPLIRQVIPLYYANPADLITRIQELGILSPRGKLSLTQSAGQNTLSKGTGLRPRVREDLVVSDVEECVVAATDWIRKLDVTDGQVMIESRILSITDTDTKKMGVEWNGYQSALNLSIAGTTTKWNPSSSTSWGPLTGGASAILSSSNLTATLHALSTLENVETLSHPLVVLGNRTEGQIEVLSKKQNYIITTDQSTPNVGTAVKTYTVQWKEVPIGLTLWVSPEISPDRKHVRLSVNQKMLDLLGNPIVATSPENKAIPLASMVETTERTLDTRAVVRDGDTLVVGGLVTTKNTVKDGKVPFLGSIPLLGRLFRYEDKLVIKENLVIMITPTILAEDTPETGYEPKSEAKANKLSALGKDYFYNKPEKKEDGLSAEAQKAQEEEQPVVSGVEPTSEVSNLSDSQQPATQQPTPALRVPEAGAQ